MMSEMAGKKISAVITCYRDAPAVPVMHERLTSVFRKIGVDYEIIFVNDASPDNAREVLQELALRDEKVVVINHSRNFGAQSAFTSGMQVASGDAVVLLDGDMQDPPELIEAFYQKWQEGYEVVYGERVRREGTLFLRFAYKAFYRLFRYTSYVAIPLDAGEFSLMDRRVVDALNALPEKNRLIRGLRAWVGYRQIGVPYDRPERMFGRSNQSLLRNFGWARKAILSFSYAPLDLITWLALATVGLSFLTIVFQVLAKLIFPEAAPRGFPMMLCFILFLGGIQLLCLSIIGSYLAHIYDEVKRRPPYIIESVLNKPAPRRKTNGKSDSPVSDA